MEDKDKITISVEEYSRLKADNLAYQNLFIFNNIQKIQYDETLIRKQIVLALRNLSQHPERPDDKYTLQSIRKEICRIRGITDFDIKNDPSLKYIRDIHKYIPLMNIDIITLRANKKGVMISKDHIKHLMDTLSLSSDTIKNSIPKYTRHTNPTNILNRPSESEIERKIIDGQEFITF